MSRAAFRQTARDVVFRDASYTTIRARTFLPRPRRNVGVPGDANPAKGAKGHKPPNDDVTAGVMTHLASMDVHAPKRGSN